MLPAGNQALSVTFTPMDPTDYTTAAASTEITVVGPVSLSKSTLTVSPSPSRRARRRL